LDLFAGCKQIKLLLQPERVHIDIELPPDLYRRLHETAARYGCTAQQLILRSIETAVDATPWPRPKQRLSLDEPLVPPTGKPINPTEEQIYGVGFP
jgi:hypothetical protein